MAFFYIGLAGTAGAICRMLLSRFITMSGAAAFPWGTFACNMIGSFLLGLLSFVVISRLSDRVKQAVNTGFIGSFTTFSAFGVETMTLLQHHAYGIAFIYVSGSLFGGLALSWAGIRLGETLNIRSNGRLHDGGDPAHE